MEEYLEIDTELFTRNPDFVFRKVIEETILVPVHMDVAEMDGIYTLNDVGAFIWEQLEKPLGLDNLQALLLDEFEVSPEIATADLETFINDMLEIGALQKVDGELS